MSKLLSVVRETASSRIVDCMLIDKVESHTDNLSAKLVEKWPPFTHYFQTVITEDLHNYFTRDEVRVIEKLAKGAAEHYAVDSPGATRITCDVTVPKSREAYKSVIRDCFRKYEGNVTIVSGEADYKIYDWQMLEVIANTTSSLEKKATFICGPVLLVDDEFGEDKTMVSIVPKLGELENVKLYYSDKRITTHFRLAGGARLYVEDPHFPSPDQRNGWLFDEGSAVVSRFGKLLDAILKSGSVRESKRPEEDFLFLTDSELLQLRARVVQSGKHYDECTKEELIQLMG